MMRVHPSAVHGMDPAVSKEFGENSPRMGEKGLSSGARYSGQQMEDLVAQEDLFTNNENFYKAEPSPQACNGNKRRSSRIPCRNNVVACVRTKFESIVVGVVNVSRKGMCFRSVEQFSPGTAVSVATYYIEGGENIFQDGKIVRVRHSPSGLLTEYGVEF